MTAKKFTPTYPNPLPTPKAAPKVRKSPPTDYQIEDALLALRPMLTALRWGHSGGYSGRQGGRWRSSSTGISATPEQLDALFAFAGVTPDEIESRGDCSDCVNSDWGINGDYHEYAFGSRHDREGNLWVVLCLTGSGLRAPVR